MANEAGTKAVVDTSGTKAIVVGGGLGGLSAAISLATRGYSVELFEKNDKLGGKLNVKEVSGFKFDLGPSIIILPHIFRRLWERAGVRMEDYVTFRELRPHWRSFFEDGVRLDLSPDMREMERELAKLGEDPSGYYAYVEHSRKLYKFLDEVYLERGADGLFELMRGKSLTAVVDGTDCFHTMAQGIERFIKSPHLRDVLGFFIKYVGSHHHDAPGMMNLLAYSQLGYGLWYVDGGLYNLARGMTKLAGELGVRMHTGAEVTRIESSGRAVQGVWVRGELHRADVVVSNMEVIPAYERLLGQDPKSLTMRRYQYMYEPAASGLVIDIGVDRPYPELAHHNFFYSRDVKGHLDDIHRRKILPEDPTLYVVCPTQTDPTVAPKGHHIIKILPHIPYLQDTPFAPDAYDALKQRCFAKLERMGLVDLRKHIVVEDVLRPEDIARMYYSNRGSIYGVVSDRKRNMAFKAPKKSELFDNLYFAGGSVNPGGGTPMVVLSGQLVADRIAKDYPTPTEPRTAVNNPPRSTEPSHHPG